MKISIGVMSCYKFKDRYDAIKETWGKDFDRIFYFGGCESNPNELIPFNYPEKYSSILYIQHDIYKYLYEQNNDSDWYCVINDDAILFKENLEFILSQYDRNEDLYLGTSNYKSEALPFSRYVKDKNSPLAGLYYASGGPGFYISNSLMKKIYDLNEKMLSLWIIDSNKFFNNLDKQCIDAGLGYQLYKLLNIRTVDINTEDYRLYTQPPSFYIKHEWRLCKNPMGFHYILPDQMRKLYNSKIYYEKKLNNLWGWYDRIPTVNEIKCYIKKIIRYDRNY